MNESALSFRKKRRKISHFFKSRPAQQYSHRIRPNEKAQLPKKASASRRKIGKKSLPYQDVHQKRPLASGKITKLNGTPVKTETATTIRDGDVLQIGEGVYLYIIEIPNQKIKPEKRIKPVVKPERYLKTLKKNPNYNPVNLIPRK